MRAANININHIINIFLPRYLRLFAYLWCLMLTKRDCVRTATCFFPTYLFLDILTKIKWFDLRERNHNQRVISIYSAKVFLFVCVYMCVYVAIKKFLCTRQIQKSVCDIYLALSNKTWNPNYLNNISWLLHCYVWLLYCYSITMYSIASTQRVINFLINYI